MGAAMGGHASTVTLLLAAGAKASVKNDFGETAADLATAKGHADCEALLKSPE
jgi:ankyrin repeat protein